MTYLKSIADIRVASRNSHSSLQMRDVKAVGSKFYHVIVPRDGSLLLNDWDLWGPLIICTILAIILQGHSHGKCEVIVFENFPVS